MTSLRASRRTWIALIAGYALALQALVGAHALGAKAALWQIEQFGSVICVEHGSAPAPSDASGTDGHDLACCLLGCNASVTTILPPSEITAIPLLVQNGELAPPHTATIIPTLFGAGRPGNPRAPPESA